MKTITFSRNNGYHMAVVFENNKSMAVSTKTFKTQDGAEKFALRIKEICGENYENRNLIDLYQTTTIEDGVATTTKNFVNENIVAI